MKQISGGITAVPGIRASGVHGGLKSDNQKDVALIVADSPAVAAGVFTRNRVCAATVLLSREHLKDPVAQAIVVNSGNANACTGEPGLDNARKMAALVGEQLDIEPQNVLVSSTGVIGVQLPMDAIRKGIERAADTLREDGGHDAAQAIMTTDTVPKEIAVEIEVGGEKVKIGGMTKGSGMIAPNMATMLAFLAADVNIAGAPLQEALRKSVNKSFNRVTVDTDRSTNDTVQILATGSARNSEITEASGDDFDAFYTALEFVCIELAKKIARDGEGATKMIEVVVKNAKSEAEAELAARATAESPLVKTAVFGKDANWGRIMMAVGKSEAQFDPYQVNVWLGNYQLVKAGMDSGFDEEKATQLFSEDTTLDVRYSYDYR